MHIASVLGAVLLSLPGAALANQNGRAFEQRCEREMKPRFEVVAQIAEFRVKDNFSTSRLSPLVYNASLNQFVLGMTSGTMRTEILIDGPGIVDPTGTRECIAPRIFVDLAFRPLDVYVAREFGRSSCPYREVYAHEMRHVALYREGLPLIQQKVAQALAARYGDRPIYAAPQQGLAQLERDVDHWLRPLIKDELAKVEELQRAVDTPEEITRMATSCGGEVEKIIGHKF